MGHDRGDCMNTISSSGDEEGYTSASFPTLSLDPCNKSSPRIVDEAADSRQLVSDDTDQQFWAEDELSITNSCSRVFKRQRRHSVAHRNRTYRSRSRLNHKSSSSSNLSNVKSPRVRRRKKRHNRQNRYPIISRISNSSTRRSTLRINYNTRIQLYRSKKK